MSYFGGLGNGRTGGASIYKYGKVCMLSMSVDFTAGTLDGSFQGIGTLPYGYRPIAGVATQAVDQSGKPFYCYIASDGTVKVIGSTTTYSMGLYATYVIPN